MIDISHKQNSLRYARATGKLFAKPETLEKVRENLVPKGDVANMCRAGGIQAAKRTADWMIFSHPIPLDFVDVSMSIESDGLRFTAEAQTNWKTGVEMEAVTAITGALLNAYDMLKPIQTDIHFGEVKLLEKTGGKSDFKDSI